MAKDAKGSAVIESNNMVKPSEYAKSPRSRSEQRQGKKSTIFAIPVPSYGIMAQEPASPVRSAN
jgi:hypothetical protein